MNEDRIAKLEARVAALEEATKPADIDGQYGDPEIRKDPSPKHWTGASYKGRKMSQCPPEYLDAFAKYKDACAYMNEKEGDPDKAKYVTYDRRDAKRARAWAERLRSRPAAPTGFAAAAVAAAPMREPGDDSDLDTPVAGIPF